MSLQTSKGSDTLKTHRIGHEVILGRHGCDGPHDALAAVLVLPPSPFFVLSKRSVKSWRPAQSINTAAVKKLRIVTLQAPKAIRSVLRFHLHTRTCTRHESLVVLTRMLLRLDLLGLPANRRRQLDKARRRRAKDKILVQSCIVRVIHAL
jgi:hypothetical protein